MCTKAGSAYAMHGIHSQRKPSTNTCGSLLAWDRPWLPPPRRAELVQRKRSLRPAEWVDVEQLHGCAHTTHHFCARSIQITLSGVRTYCVFIVDFIKSAMAMLLKAMTARLGFGVRSKPLQCQDACCHGAERTHRHHQRTEVRPRMNPPLSITSRATTTLHVTNVSSSQCSYVGSAYGYVI